MREKDFVWHHNQNERIITEHFVFPIIQNIRMTLN